MPDTKLERGVIIRINGDGSLSYEPVNMTPVELIGVLELTKQYAFHDLVKAEEQHGNVGTQA